MKPEASPTRRHLVRLTAAAAIGSAAVVGMAMTPSSAAKAAGRHSDPYCPPICFLKGTRILTDRGQQKIEDLRIGDLVATHRGTLEPIKWIGRMSYERAERKRWQSEVAPVKVEASAIASGVPSRDLFLSQRHAIFNGEGALIPAKYLVNGETLQIDAPAGLTRLEYFQLEFEEHEIIFAEEMPVESFLGGDDLREMFSNFAEYLRLYGPTSKRMTPYVPVYRYGLGKDDAIALLRIGVTALGLNVRDPVQAFHHRLEQRSKMLRGQQAAEAAAAAVS